MLWKFVGLCFLVGVVAVLCRLTNLVGPYAFGYGGNPSPANPQSAYVPQPGDCVVLPQGQDAVYDLYYAEKVNPANCKAYIDQSQAQLFQAQATAIIDNEVRDDNQIGIGIGLGAILGFLLLLGALFVVSKIVMR